MTSYVGRFEPSRKKTPCGEKAIRSGRFISVTYPQEIATIPHPANGITSPRSEIPLPLRSCQIATPSNSLPAVQYMTRLMEPFGAHGE